MSCCGKSGRDFKFCPECGKKILENSHEVKKVREFLNEIFLSDGCNVIINKSDLGKNVTLDKKYERYEYVECTRSSNEHFVRICSVYYPYCRSDKTHKNASGAYCRLNYGSILNAIKDDRYIIKTNNGELTLNYSQYNDILEDMKIPYFHPYAGGTIEEAIVGFTKSGINNPTFLHEVICDDKYKKYTIFKSSYTSVERVKCSMTPKYIKNLQQQCDKITSSIKGDIYMLDDKLYLLEELNDKYCNNSNLTIDWKKCIDRVHCIKDININVLCGETIYLLKRIEENFRIKKLITAVKGIEGVDTENTINNMLEI